MLVGPTRLSKESYRDPLALLHTPERPVIPLIASDCIGGTNCLKWHEWSKLMDPILSMRKHEMLTRFP
jgi:hypothetical protein